ncbi:Protein kinase domain-containing protein [Mycena sanguinolenta]|uniref:Protein kinase domain-containing protein n=1 Tax=Mycena sanguinolenta TaxID=230812 RepID=A0A8H7DK96_9AGAR|nr:Protein kinase domain-containing protein [Mycena sanguinolenta]
MSLNLSRARYRSHQDSTLHPSPHCSVKRTPVMSARLSEGWTRSLVMKTLTATFWPAGELRLNSFLISYKICWITTPMSRFYGRRKLFKALKKLSRASGLHPRCFTLRDLELGKHVAGGSFSDVYKGSFRGQSVAVKVMRVFDKMDITVAVQNFGQEAVIWRQLSHPNLLPFFGLYYLDERPCLVSPWMENGDIRTFLRNRSWKLDSRNSFILDVALGLQHLCEKHVVHGDLKTANILVTPSFRACITDFGLSTTISSLQLATSSTHSRGGTIRYQAPELLRGGHNNSESDIYAFACVAYEIMTETYPFEQLRSDGAVITAVLRGNRPSVTAECENDPAQKDLWVLIHDCWQDKPELRPTSTQIVQRLRSPQIEAYCGSAIDWDATFTSRFRRSLQLQPTFPTVAEIEHIIFWRRFALVAGTKSHFILLILHIRADGTYR